MLNDIAAEIIAGIVVAVLFAMAAIWRRQWLIFFQRRRIFFAAPRLASEGISNIVTSRDQYNRYRTEKSLEAFVDTAQGNFAYFGVAFTSATGPTRLDETLRKMLLRGVDVNIYLVDPSASTDAIDVIASLYGYDRKHLTAMCSQAVAHFTKFRDGLSEKERQKLHIKLHQIPLYYSAFIFDRGTKYQKFLVDYKIIGVGKDHSFGIQFDGIERANTLYSRLLQSLSVVGDHSKPLNG